jgi:hypothetical protein
MHYSRISLDSESEREEFNDSTKEKRSDSLEKRSLFRGQNGSPLTHPSDSNLQLNDNQAKPTSVTAKLKNLKLVNKISTSITSAKEKTENIDRLENSHSLQESDSLLIHTTPEQLSSTQNSDKLKELPSSQKDQPGISRSKSSKSVTFEESDKFEKESNSTEFQAGLIKRTPQGRKGKLLALDTSHLEATSSGTIYSAQSSSAVSTIHDSDIELVQLSDIVDSNSNTLQSGNHNKLTDNKLSIAFQEYRYKLLQTLAPRTDARSPTMSVSSDLENIKGFLTLCNKLRIRSVFYDPEFDIINRFCLEFNSIAAKTDSNSLFQFRKPGAIRRVYDYMDERANSVSTPMDEEPYGPDIPTLLTHLFLNDFRVKSDGTNAFGISVPLFSHANRLSFDRFDAIAKLVFERRDFFFRNIDIARHNITAFD